MAGTRVSLFVAACVLLLAWGCVSNSGNAIAPRDLISGDCVKNHTFKQCVDACLLASPVPSGSIFNQCYHNTVEKELELLQSRGCPQSGNNCMSVDEFGRIANESCDDISTILPGNGELGEGYKQECYDLAASYGAAKNLTEENTSQQPGGQANVTVYSPNFLKRVGFVNRSEIGGDSLNAYTVYLADPVSGDGRFVTVVMNFSTQLVTVNDSSNRLRGEAISLPEDKGVLVVDAESTAIAVLWPPFGKRPLVGMTQQSGEREVQQIKSEPCFPALRDYLKTNLKTRNVDELTSPSNSEFATIVANCSK